MESWISVSVTSDSEAGRLPVETDTRDVTNRTDHENPEFKLDVRFPEASETGRVRDGDVVSDRVSESRNHGRPDNKQTPVSVGTVRRETALFAVRIPERSDRTYFAMSPNAALAYAGQLSRRPESQPCEYYLIGENSYRLGNTWPDQVGATCSTPHGHPKGPPFTYSSERPALGDESGCLDRRSRSRRLDISAEHGFSLRGSYRQGYSTHLQHPVGHQSRLQWIYPRTYFKLKSVGRHRDPYVPMRLPTLYDTRRLPICMLVRCARGKYRRFLARILT